MHGWRHVFIVESAERRGRDTRVLLYQKWLFVLSTIKVNGITFMCRQRKDFAELQARDQAVQKGGRTKNTKNAFIGLQAFRTMTFDKAHSLPYIRMGQ